jgi:hypothetical protein
MLFTGAALPVRRLSSATERRGHLKRQLDVLSNQLPLFDEAELASDDPAPLGRCPRCTSGRLYVAKRWYARELRGCKQCNVEWEIRK